MHARDISDMNFIRARNDPVNQLIHNNTFSSINS